MAKAIVTGTGFEALRSLLPELETRVDTIRTRYGKATVVTTSYRGEEIVILPRHGLQHEVPPHRINHRANLKALHQLGVTAVLGILAVGSLSTHVPPGTVVVLDQFLDFTRGPVPTFFHGGRTGVVHTTMTEPYCAALREQLAALAAARHLPLVPRGTYVCTSGPRLETAAEIRMFRQLGGDVVGMTGVPEACLARELGLHYAGVAYSVNWAAGIEPGDTITFLDRELEELKRALLGLCLEALCTAPLDRCACERAQRLVLFPPEPGLP